MFRPGRGCKDVYNSGAGDRVWGECECGIWDYLLDLDNAVKMPPVFQTGGIVYVMGENQSGVGG